MEKTGKDSSVSGLSNRRAGKAVVRREDGEAEQLWEGEEEQDLRSGVLRPASMGPTEEMSSRRLDLRVWSSRKEVQTRGVISGLIREQMISKATRQDEHTRE